MEALILKIEKHRSKMGDEFLYVFFKGTEDGKSYRSCLYPKFGNYKRWASLLKEGNVVGNLRAKGSLIDADSYPRKVGEQKLVKPAGSSEGATDSREV